jgi:hypothetical protein
MGHVLLLSAEQTAFFVTTRCVVDRVALLFAALAVAGCSSRASAPHKTASTPEAASTAEPVAGTAPSEGVSAGESDANRFHSQSAGFTIVKPGGWTFATPQMENANRRRTSVGDPKLDEQLRRATHPLVVIIKHDESFPKLNPTVRVVLRPFKRAEGMSLRELASTVVGEMEKSLLNFELDGEIGEVLVAGRSAAHFRAKFGVVQVEQQKSFPVLTRMWIVPRGPNLFLIAMSGPPDGEDVSEAEFAQILRSIEIAD